MANSSRDVVLFAVVGMSPAVLTETVWALAHEREPVIPDRVVVLTTVTARDQIVRQLFEKDGDQICAWERLKEALSHQGFNLDGKLKFGNTGDSIRIFTNADGTGELADIATSEDNTAASDFMLRHLREFTANPFTVVIASIAGGRKTMSALMISCMSLLGREQDLVCHVLVNPPFESLLTPPFLFPIKNAQHVDRSGKSHSAADAIIELTYVPYVRMLGWYQDKFKIDPPGYSALVAGVQRQVPKVYPLITLDMKAGQVLIDDETVDLAPSEFMVLHQRCLGNRDLTTIGANLWRYKKSKSCVQLDFYHRFLESSRFGVEDSLKEDVSRCDSSLRRKLNLTALSPYVDDLIPKRGKPHTYPRSKIKIKGSHPFQ